MQGTWWIGTIGIALWLMAPGVGAHAQELSRQAAFGSAVSQRIPDYTRAAPQVGTAGPINDLGIMEAKGVGFRSVVILGPDGEAIAEMRSVAEFALLDFFLVTVSEPLPSREEIAAIAEIVDDPANQPVLLSGSDVDRTGIVWALYRHYSGYPPEIALEEGRTAGLTASEAAVRDHLGLPGPP